ncbi:uncharacterized protein CLUP02_09921 [Colletotrichum lupini]|uniref:Uncharacterized protein n=1 Tax=Colletotrichum lupini TaxID=145971 RepID=A0A9Q8SVR7_9PEZI|nr:uncharacterized protein CLUP02_09921 [Colletotrichum lupini]KAK1711644.1 hypothetical protein BDP67DRAFT_62761 [Colletotrichum lupini]UQC84424.1 hypothetical protein CLUP02_09921 [Colletotrichum lupini]
MQSSNMSLRTLFRGAIHVIRFFQMANLSFTTYTICYAAWLRSQEYRNVIKYHDVSNQTFLDMKEAAMIIACAALGIEVFINSDFNKPSDPRLSIMSLAAYSMGLCFYATMPAARQYLAHNGALTDLGSYVDFSKLDTALWRTSLAYGMVTWASSVVFVLSTVVDRAERAILQKSGISGVGLHAMDQTFLSHDLKLDTGSPV